MTKISFLKTALMLSIGIVGVNTELKASKSASAETKASAPSNPSDMNRAVATFADGSTIKFQEIQDLMAQLPPKLRDAPFSKLYAGLLNRLVDSKVLLNAAIKGGFDKDPEALKRIADAKELLLQKAFLDQEIDKLMTDDVLRVKYAELVKLLPKDEMESDVSHILFDNKEDAEKALKELQSAGRNTEKKFYELVLSKSTDKSTKENKGSIGWVRKTDVKNEALFKAEKDSLVPQVLKVFDQGYSVFYVKDKRPIQPPEFDAIKSNIRQAVTPQYAVQVVDKMRRDSGLKLTGLDNQPLPLPDLPPMPDSSGKTPEKKVPERKDFSAVNEKALDNSMVVGVFANGDKITLGQVRDSLGSIPEQLKNAPFHQLFEPLLLRVADTRLLLEAAKKAGLEKSPDLIKKQEDVEKGMFQRAYLDKQFAQIITPEMLKEAYQEFLKIFPKDDMEIRIKHIMVASKDEATSLLKEIKSGKVKFNDELVKAKSIDPQTKETGGDLGYIPKKQLPADLGDILFKAAKATLISEPIALGESGYSIIRVEDKRAVQPPSIEEIRPQLTQAVSQREAAKIVMKLREESKAILRDMDGNIMANTPTPAAVPAA